MTELNSVLEYIDELSPTLQAGALTDQDRMICYIIHNRLVNAIDVNNPRYKTMADLMKESVLSIREMRDDVERMIKARYNDVALVDDLTVLDAIIELGMITLDDHQNCVSYLADLAVTSLVTLRSNPDMEEEISIVFKTLIYICVIGLNRFNVSSGLPQEKKGVSISFDRKRAREKLGV